MGKIAILGAGSFGTGIAAHLGRTSNNQIMLYARRPEIAEQINQYHQNPPHTQKKSLPENIVATTQLEEALTHAHVTVSALPAQQFRTFFQQYGKMLDTNTIVVNTAKGIELSSTKNLSQIYRELELPQSYAVLSGPAFAKDLVEGNPVGLTLASKDKETRKRIRTYFHHGCVDIKESTDIIGVEVGGALKNPYAILAGIIEELNIGRSILGDYVNRAMVEIRDMGCFLGGSWDTFNGRTGLGDLVLCMSEQSRNFRFGKYLVDEQRHGAPNEESIKNAITLCGGTIEGIPTTKAMYHLVTQQNMFAPLIRELHDILYEPYAPLDGLVQRYRTKDAERVRETPHWSTRFMKTLFPRIWYRRTR